MFIHFNFIAGVQPKHYQAWIIPVAREGRPEPGQGGSSLVFCRPSSIIIRPSASVCLPASSLFISITPPGSCQRDLLEPRRTSVMFSPQSAVSSISARECIYIFAVSGSFSVSPELSIKVDSLCVSVYLSRPAYQARPSGWWWFADGRSFDRGISVREPVWRKTVRGNWQGIEEVMNPCNKSSVDSELIPPAQRGGDGREGWTGLSCADGCWWNNTNGR